MSAITEAMGLASFEDGCHTGLRGEQGTDLAQPAPWENPVRSEGLQAVLFSVVPPTPLRPREHPSMGKAHIPSVFNTGPLRVTLEINV